MPGSLVSDQQTFVGPLTRGYLSPPWAAGRLLTIPMQMRQLRLQEGHRAFAKVTQRSGQTDGAAGLGAGTSGDEWMVVPTATPPPGHGPPWQSARTAAGGGPWGWEGWPALGCNCQTAAATDVHTSRLEVSGVPCPSGHKMPGALAGKGAGCERDSSHRARSQTCLLPRLGF